MGLSLGGESRVRPADRLHRLAELQTSQEIQEDLTRGLAKNGSEPGTAVPYNTYHGSAARNSVLWGGLLNLSTRIGDGTKLSFNNTYTRSADNEAQVLDGDNEEFSQFNPLALARLDFIERAVRSNQVQGEHLFGEKQMLNWSVTNSGVDRNEPDRSDVGYMAKPDANGQLQPATWVGQPRFATRTFSDLDEHSWDLGANYRLFLGSPSTPVALKVGGAYRTHDRDADTRAYDLYNVALNNAEKSVQPEDLFTPTNAIGGDFMLNANANGGRYTADGEDHGGVRSGRGAADRPAAADRRRPGRGVDLDRQYASRRREPPSYQSAQHRHPAGTGADLPAEAQPEPSALRHPDPLPARVPRALPGRLLRAGRAVDDGR